MTTNGDALPDGLTAEMVDALAKIAKSLPYPIKPFKCVSCGASLYIIVTASTHGVDPCPVCGGSVLSGVKLRNLIASFGGGRCLAEKAVTGA